MVSLRLVLITGLLISGLLAVNPSLAASSIDCNAIHQTVITSSSHSIKDWNVHLKTGETFWMVVTIVSGDTSGLVVGTDVDGSKDQSEYPGTYKYTVETEGVYHIQAGVFDNTDQSPATVKLVYRCGGGLGGSADSQGKPCDGVADGRIDNNPAIDCGAPIAIYKSSVDIYGIDPHTGSGALVISIGEAALKAQHDPAGGSVLLGSGAIAATGQLVSVYWLTTNEIEVVTAYPDGKPYIVAWPVDHPEQLYHLAW